MVKHHYFQLVNGELSFVLDGTKEELLDLIHKDFEMDKQEALRQLSESLAGKEKTLAELEKQEPADEGAKLENDCKIANLKKSIYENKQETEKVKAQEKSNLVFYELTPVEL